MAGGPGTRAIICLHQLSQLTATYIYIYIYTHIHTHHIAYIYIYNDDNNNNKHNDNNNDNDNNILMAHAGSTAGHETHRLQARPEDKALSIRASTAIPSLRSLRSVLGSLHDKAHWR